MNSTAVGKRIQSARRRLGMTQTELADQLGMTPKYISNIECGAKIPRLETFVAIANTLGVDANILLMDVLTVSDEIRCSQLWEHLAKLPAEKRTKALRVLDLMVQEL